MDLREFNTAPADELTAALLACCDVPAWAAAVQDGRPYASVEDAVTVADRAAHSFTAEEVTRAVAAHPRIGERPAQRGTEAAWSRQEQSGVSTDADVQARLAAANHAYERRFDRVFLICATGLSAGQVLAAAEQRLGNDDTTEAAVVADELRQIAVLRLRKLLAD